MIKIYLRYILEPLFRFAWLHVPWFADYAVEFVKQVQHKVQDKLMQPDFIEQARIALAEKPK